MINEPTVAAPITEKAGSRIGPYKLLQQIGQGGFGVVFMAEQEQPVRRRVALKIIKLGMDTRAVVARFEAERQALAMMDHPNIARVLDAGATDVGRPYFVMELVRGDPITQYCDTNHLATSERLGLFTQVCHAVQHAHQKGIIHRDIKPSNVLVTVADGRPIPKVIDFGIAKATSTRLTDKTLFTEHRALIGTPAYMSPEQAEMSGVDVDTRSDIYSLGVLLYELLTGTTPFDPDQLRSAAFGELQRIIREIEPPRPSTRLSTLKNTAAKVAAHRHTEPAKLSALLRGDLDWIVMKAMEKDRTRRYETANELAMDVMRHLAGEAVLAAPPSVAYRFRKFVRRKKGVVVSAGLTAAALLLGVIGFAWQAHRAGLQRDRAQLAEATATSERDRAQAVTDFVIASLQSQDPSEKGRQDMTIAEAMRQAAGDLQRGGLQDQPASRALMLRTIAVIMGNNGQPEEAESLARQAVNIERGLCAGDCPALAESLDCLAKQLNECSRVQDAEPLAIEALEMRRRLFGPEHPSVADSLTRLAEVRFDQGAYAAAEELTSEALGILERNFPGDHEKIATSLGWLASIKREISGNEEEALLLHQRSLKMRRRLRPGDSPQTAGALLSIGMCYCNLGRERESEAALTESLEMLRRLHPGDHSSIANVFLLLGGLRQSQSRLTEAESLVSDALAMYRRIFTGDHFSTAVTLNNLSTIRSEARPGSGLALLNEALGMYRRLYPKDHPHMAKVLMNIAMEHRRRGALVEAEELGDEALAMARRCRPADHPDMVGMMNGAARIKFELDKDAEAERLLSESTAVFGRLAGEGSLPRHYAGCAAAYLEAGRFTQALERYKAVLEIHQRAGTSESIEAAEVMCRIAQCHMQSARNSAAFPLLQDALGIMHKLKPGDHPQTAMILRELGRCRSNLGLGEVIETIQSAVDMLRRLHPNGHFELVAAMMELSDRVERPEEALSLLQEALEMARNLNQGGSANEAMVVQCMAVCLSRLGRNKEALLLWEKASSFWKAHYHGPSGLAAKFFAEWNHFLNTQGRYVEALAAAQECLAIRQRLSPGGSVQLAAAYVDVASAYQRLGRLDEAIQASEAGLAIARRLPEDHQFAYGLMLLSSQAMYRLAGQHERSLESGEEFLRHPQASQKPGWQSTVVFEIAFALANLGRFEEAEKRAMEAIEICRAHPQATRGELPTRLWNAGVILRMSGKLDEAERIQREAVETCRTEPHNEEGLAQALNALGMTLSIRGKHAEAASTYLEAAAVLRDLHTDDTADIAGMLGRAAEEFLAADNLDESSVNFEASIAMQRRLNDARALAGSLANYGTCFVKLGTPAAGRRVEPVLRECVEIREELFPDDHPDKWLKYNAQSLLGHALILQAEDDSNAIADRINKLTAAEPLLLTAYDKLKDDPSVPTPAQNNGADRRREALERIAELYEVWNRIAPDKAREALAAQWQKALRTYKAS